MYIAFSPKLRRQLEAGQGNKSFVSYPPFLVLSALLLLSALGLGVIKFLHALQVSDQKDGAGIVLSLDSKNEELLEVARKTLVQMLPSDLVTSEDRDAVAKKINLA